MALFKTSITNPVALVHDLQRNSDPSLEDFKICWEDMQKIHRDQYLTLKAAGTCVTDFLHGANEPVWVYTKWIKLYWTAAGWLPPETKNPCEIACCRVRPVLKSNINPLTPKIELNSGLRILSDLYGLWVSISAEAAEEGELWYLKKCSYAMATSGRMQYDYKQINKPQQVENLTAWKGCSTNWLIQMSGQTARNLSRSSHINSHSGQEIHLNKVATKASCKQQYQSRLNHRGPTNQSRIRTLIARLWYCGACSSSRVGIGVWDSVSIVSCNETCGINIRLRID